MLNPRARTRCVWHDRGEDTIRGRILTPSCQHEQDRRERAPALSRAIARSYERTVSTMTTGDKHRTDVRIADRTHDASALGRVRETWRRGRHRLAELTTPEAREARRLALWLELTR